MSKVKQSVHSCLMGSAVRNSVGLRAGMATFVVAFLLLGCEAEESSGGWVPPPVRVESVRVEATDFVPEVDLVGSLEAVHEVVVTAEVNGLVKDITFESGAWIEQGSQVLSLKSDVESAEVARYQAQYDLSKKELARALKLKDIGASQSRIDTLKKELDETAANIAWLETIVSKKKIRAPFSGRLGVSQVHLGQYLTPGQAIVTLTNDDSFYVDFMLPERYLSQLAPGSQLKVLQGDVDLGGAKVIAIDPQLDELSRSTRVRALLSATAPDLHSGMFVRVAVQLAAHPNAIMIPSEAVESTTFGDSVYVIDQSEATPKAKRRAVTIGDRPNDRVRVVSGLHVGDVLVVSGQNRLRDGAVVELSTAAGLQAASALE